MCIILLSTAHPDYSLILLSNRDEYLSRPTAPAQWWGVRSEHGGYSGEDILAGRDLRHPSHGTWLGVTRKGRIAALTNFREENEDADAERDTNPKPVDIESLDQSSTQEKVRKPAVQKLPFVDAQARTRSRGEITKDYLCSDKPAQEWAADFLAEQNKGQWGDMGGYSLIYGALQPGKGVRDEGNQVRIQSSVLSNRTTDVEMVKRLFSDNKTESKEGQRADGRSQKTHALTCSLSNSHFGDMAWPKVVRGELLLSACVEECRSGGTSRVELLDLCFGILSTDSMAPRAEGEVWSSYAKKLKESIFIPAIDVGGGQQYGTQKQTVVLVERGGKVLFVERTLWDSRGRRVGRDEGERQFEFEIEKLCTNLGACDFARVDLVRRCILAAYCTVSSVRPRSQRLPDLKHITQPPTHNSFLYSHLIHRISSP